MYESCREKQSQMVALFAQCETEDLKYQKIIEMGREQPPLEKAYKIPENIVRGCQSTMYLHSHLKDGQVYFEAESDALISSGLAAILLRVYSGETPETVLKCPPDYLEELGITASLTPNRANGLYSMHLRMKQDALRLLIGKKG
jgi:cysteine desulfuration protein SufE